MYTSILFLILFLLLISLAPTSQGILWEISAKDALIGTLYLYGLTLGLIILQTLLFSKKKGLKPLLLIAVNVELLVFFIFAFFFLGSFRVIEFSPTLVLLLSLFLYFLALACFYLASRQKVWSELSLIMPLALPFTLITVIFEGIQFFPTGKNFLASDSLWATMVVLFITFGFLFLMMVFFPYFLQKIWSCKSLHNKELELRLEAICQRAGFRHAGLKVWMAQENVLTAAIIGIIPRYRYIMFTKRLLDEAPPEAIEAILAHEIGHSFHKHMWIYPFILFGMSVLLGWLTLLFEPLPDVLLFFLYALLIALYFRYIFGYFSRLFERQADLFIFQLGLPAKNMIEALDFIGIAQGRSHARFSWHHFGIQQRMDFIAAADQNRSLIARHHQRVRTSVTIYFMILFVAFVLLFL